MKRIVGCVALFLVGVLLSSCSGPGHHLAFEQFEASHTGPVLAVQGYMVNREGVDLRAKWRRLAESMARKEGFILSRLSQGIGARSNLWIAHAEWRSLAELRAAFADPEILALEEALPKQAFTHLFSPDCTYTPDRVKCP